MRVDALEAYDIEPKIIDIWRTTVGARLLPVQERAVKEFALFGSGNLVVFSPTSSGKTFVGEMAAVHAARASTRVFYLVPQRALATEKFREFRRRYETVGIDVVVSSRDHREFDKQIRERAFEIAVVVFEKLQGLLVSQPDLLNDVGLVVVDELQLLTDPERGPALELLLTKLRTAAKPPRIIGLSAVLGQADLLTAWLDARLLVDERRPVELRKGVLSRGEFKYREHNSGQIGIETFRDFISKDRSDLMLSAAEDLVERGEQVLMFVPDRATALTLARALASRVRLPIATEAIEHLDDTENTRMREVLRETLESSVAFHHADMTGDEREIVEGAFRTGAIRALVATSTLAVGVNLPARNVILDGRKWITGLAERPYREDLSKSEYENMSGRAGRLEFTTDFGRSILVTHSPFQAETWLEHYVGRTFEDISPTLKNAPLDDLVLDLVATQNARTREQITDLLLASFTGRVHWTEKMGRERFLKAVCDSLAICLNGGLVRATNDDVLSVSKVGKVAAGRSMGAKTAIRFAQWAKEPHAGPPAPLEVLTLLGQTVAGASVYVRLTWREDRDSTYKADLLARIEAAGLQQRAVFASFTGSRMALEDDEAKAAKKALALGDWIEELPTREIEDRYETWAGSLKRIGEEYAWLCEGLAAMCGACGWAPAWRRTIELLGERLSYGVKEDALEVMRLRVPRLSRGMVNGLRGAGLLDGKAIREAAEGAVRKAVGRRGVADALVARCTSQHASPGSPKASSSNGICRIAPAPTGADEGSHGGPPPTEPVRSAGYQIHPEVPSSRAAEAAPDDGHASPIATQPPTPELVIDVAARRAVLWGQVIASKPPRNLSPQLFLALAALAAEPGKVISMPDLANAVHRLGRLSRRPVAPDPRDLRYRLLRSLRKALENNSFRERLSSLVETVPGYGLRLTCTTAVLGVDPRPQL